MKICPICDKKIIGNWCNSCFKIVEPWTISDGIYINERHSGNVTPDCEYHSPKIQYSKQEYMAPGYEEKIYGNASVASRQVVKQRQAGNSNAARTVTTSRSNASGKNDKKKMGLGAKIAIGYFIFIILSSFLPVVFAFIDEVDSGSVEPEYSFNVEQPVTVYEDEPGTKAVVEIEPSEPIDTSEVFGGTEYEWLLEIEPVEFNAYDDESYYYYSADSLKKIGRNCDNAHIDYYYQDFVTMVDKVYPGYSFSYYVDDSDNYNYAEVSKDGVETYFETYVTMEHKDFMIDVSYDTSSEQLHYYMFSAEKTNDNFYDEMYKWFEEAMPTLFTSYDEWMEIWDIAAANDNYTYMQSGDMVVYFMIYEDYVLVDFESVNYY